MIGLSSATRMRGPSPGSVRTTGSGSAAGAASAVAARCSGASNQNVDPAPGALSKPIDPPIMSTSRLQMARPRPVPPNLRVVAPSAWVKLVKSFGWASSGTPQPVSVTSARSTVRAGPISVRLRRAVTAPSLVNLTALPTRLNRICFRRTGSPTTRAPAAPSSVTSKPSCFSSARGRQSERAAWTSSSISNVVRSRSILPASILDRSSTSLSRRMRISPEVRMVFARRA